jgi:dTDP-4-dehydrorhamnose reductase
VSGAVAGTQALITGMNGTVAPALAAELRARGAAIMAWDRAAVSPDDDRAVERHVRESAATAVVHCGMGDPRWAEHLAACCGRLGIEYLFTSSASVFGPHQSGPHSVDVVPEPNDDYGRYKLECERRVLAANPTACVVRLGWQIALRPGGNQMVEYCMRHQRDQGHVGASTDWFPACSFLADTARMLADLLERPSRGLYQLDGNPGWDMHRIVCALNRVMGAGWDVRPTNDLRLNNMMQDDRLKSASIKDRLRGG